MDKVVCGPAFTTWGLDQGEELSNTSQIEKLFTEVVMENGHRGVRETEWEKMGNSEVAWNGGLETTLRLPDSTRCPLYEVIKLLTAPWLILLSRVSKQG